MINHDIPISFELRRDPEPEYYYFAKTKSKVGSRIIRVFISKAAAKEHQEFLIKNGIWWEL